MLLVDMHPSSIFMAWKKYLKSCTHIYLAFYMYLASIIFNDPLNYIKAYAGAFYMVMQPFEHGKHF